MTPSKDEEVTVERLDLKPDWLERKGPRKKDLLGHYIIFLLVSVGLFIFLLFTAGNLKQFIGILLLAWISFSLIYAAKKNTKSISTWRRARQYDKVENLPLKRDSKTMGRALSGLKLSQNLVERRLRRIFMEKLKDKKDLSTKEMKKLLKKPSELEKIVKNKRLTDFLLNSKRIKDVIQEKDRHLSINLLDKKERKDRSFEKKIKDVIENISRWEGK